MSIPPELRFVKYFKSKKKNLLTNEKEIIFKSFLPPGEYEDTFSTYYISINVYDKGNKLQKYWEGNNNMVDIISIVNVTRDLGIEIVEDTKKHLGNN